MSRLKIGFSKTRCCGISIAVKGRAMNRTLLCLLALLLLAAVTRVEAQPAKVVRIGFLGPNSAASNAGRMEALRAGLRELGYVEGKNLIIESRWADGNYDRLP